MKLLNIDKNTTLSELSKRIGRSNVNKLLNANKLDRVPKIGQAFVDLCNSIYETHPEVSSDEKVKLLNTLTDNSDIFEEVSLTSENGWKLVSQLRTIPGSLNVPDTVEIADSSDVLGNGISISSTVYSKAISSIRSTGRVDSNIFETSGGSPSIAVTGSGSGAISTVFDSFHIPWGDITLYSTGSGDSVDFPVYPEELSDQAVANYTQMPDMLYQYEPWQIYTSSGPRQCNINFKFHRDMWSGDHRDGSANNLVRFCEAQCYPNYNGSAVNAPTSTLYIVGKPWITGIITAVTPVWSGPIGLDGFYLYCELEIQFTEVASQALNYSTIRNKSIVG